MFTSETSNFLTQFFAYVKQLFDITWPGTNLSIFAIFLGTTVTFFVIGFAQNYLGNSFSIATSNHSNGNNRDLKVSKDRKGDEK